MKNAKIFNILRYIFGVFLIIGGLGNLSASVPFGLLITFAGIFIFPFVWKLLGKRMSFARWLPFLVPLLFFIAATPFVPASSVQSRTIVVTDETDATDSSVTDTPEATPTEIPTASPTPEETETPTPEPTKEAGEMKVHFLDVGQGLSILVQSGGQTMIYDGGDKSTSSFVVSYLQKQNVTTIDYLISSHYDSDHMAGLIGCLSAFDVKNVSPAIMNMTASCISRSSRQLRIRDLRCSIRRLERNFLSGTGSFQILAPATIDPDDSNKNSVAIKLTNGENSFIFTGDAESTSEAAMCAPALVFPVMCWFRDITVLPQLPAGISFRRLFRNMR